MSKIDPQIKIDYIKRYIDGRISQRIIAEQLGVSLASVQQWISNYKSLGVEAFLATKNKHCSSELKLSAVQNYLSGVASQQAICEKYGIRSKSKLQKWIKKYNSHEELKASRIGGTTVKYESGGVEALKDNRGRCKSEDQMIELERLRAENKILKSEKERAEMEASFIKKLDEIERRRG